MRKVYLCLIALGISLSLTGCTPTTAPTQPSPPTIVAPGYGSPADQTLGQSLAALRSFAASAKADYSNLTPSQQAEEKLPLNSLIMAVDAADQTYVAYHHGLTTIDQAQRSLAAAEAEQAAFTAKVGVR